MLTATDEQLKHAAATYFISCEPIPDYEKFVNYFSGVSLIDMKKLTLDNIEKYEWTTNREVASYPTIFEHIKTHLLPEGYSCKNGDVQLIEVKVPDYPNLMYVGQVDGVVCKLNDAFQSSSAIIAFEIKCNIDDAKESQSVFELVGLLIRSQYPVLHILTDMNTFT